jgi:hypothetical protein
MRTVRAGELSNGELVQLPDGALATRTREEGEFIVMTEATLQTDTEPGAQFYYTKQALVFPLGGNHE